MTAEPRSRSPVRIVLAVLSACGLAALAWASFVQPSAHIIYNPSDSVPVGWYGIKRANSSPHPLFVGDIVLTRLPPDTAALAAQRGYMPSHIPLLKRVGSVAPQHVCIVDAQVRIDGVPVAAVRSEEHTSELQSRGHLVCRLLLEKKNNLKNRRSAFHRRN